MCNLLFFIAPGMSLKAQVRLTSVFAVVSSASFKPLHQVGMLPLETNVSAKLHMRDGIGYAAADLIPHPAFRHFPALGERGTIENFVIWNFRARRVPHARNVVRCHLFIGHASLN